MDIKLFEGSTERDLTNPIGGISGVSDAGGLGLVPLYSFGGAITKVENIGNVDITVSVRSFLAGVPVQQVVVNPNQVVTFTLTEIDPSLPGYTPSLIVLDGKGTVTNYNRIKLGNDGKGYLGID